MKKIVLILFMSCFTVIVAQGDLSEPKKEVKTSILTQNIKESKNKVIAFIKKNDIKAHYLNYKNNKVVTHFTISKDMYVVYKELILNLGLITSNNIVTDWGDKEIDVDKKIAYLKRKESSYNELLVGLKKGSKDYLNIWVEKEKIVDRIFDNEQKISDVTSYRRGEYLVHLTIVEEVISPVNTNVKFVNMPGMEFSFLSIDNPKANFSSNNYKGYFIKHLFTEGKTFWTIGLYETNTAYSTGVDSSNEMFLIGFGQDFYSSYLGRGSRRYFNLYSSYTLGGVFVTTDSSEDYTFFYMAPSIGLELFKTNHFLLDSKIGYFVPLDKRANTNLRGISYNISFNFVF